MGFVFKNSLHVCVATVACWVRAQVAFPLVAEGVRLVFNRVFQHAKFFPKGRTQIVHGRPAVEYAIGEGLFDVETGQRIDPNAKAGNNQKEEEASSSSSTNAFGALTKNGAFVRNTTACVSARACNSIIRLQPMAVDV